MLDAIFDTFIKVDCKKKRNWTIMNGIKSIRARYFLEINLNAPNLFPHLTGQFRDKSGLN
jgi:hypothetical protein